MRYISTAVNVQRRLKLPIVVIFVKNTETYPQRDSILGPLTLQASVLPKTTATWYCVLLVWHIGNGVKLYVEPG